ncbi:NTP transferase domain-containing protein [Candidatus Saccharibacteria bacterium]|nr:MAG: NTP transferase domain-containing protein [Candidatus Saccharibacteria bacterium]
MWQKAVTKAVIAAAGFGTRFLPQTKAMPKEMLPLIDKPIIQYAVEDLVAAGIKDIIIVGSSSKRAIEDHFDVPNEDLLVNIRAGGPKKPTTSSRWKTWRTWRTSFMCAKKVRMVMPRL